MRRRSMFKKIDDYFASVTDEQLVADLEAAGFIVGPKSEQPSEVAKAWDELFSMGDRWAKEHGVDMGLLAKLDRHQRPIRETVSWMERLMGLMTSVREQARTLTGWKE